MGSLLLMSQMCIAMVLNAYAMSWFDFQNTCRLLGQEMPSATHHEKPYWTKYYKRQSDWIGKYGCYNKTDLEGTKTINMHLPSAGLCQELCVENKSSELFFFGVKKRNCTCLFMYPKVPSLPLNQCDFACLKNSVLNESLKCGGSSVYSVFVSKKDRPDMICNDSNGNCYHKEGQVPIHKDETKCNSVNENYRDKCVIELTTQIYTSFDRGKELSISDKTNILFCQQCTEKGCPFKNCTSHLNTTDCAQNVLSTAHPSVLKTITKTLVPNITEKRVSLMWITFNKLVSRYTKQTLSYNANVSRTTQLISKEDTITISSYKNQTLLHGAKLSRATQPTSKEDTLTNDSMTFIVGGLASLTVICFLLLMVAIYFIRRKHILIEEKCSTLQKQIECSRFRYEHTSIAKLNPQNKQEHQNVTWTSYYELADNSKLRETYSKNKENKEPYYDIKEPVSGNDIYMVASDKPLDGESVNFDKKDYSYDHLRGIRRSRHEENTYDHAGNVNESIYSCAEAARNWNTRQFDNDFYDHI